MKHRLYVPPPIHGGEHLHLDRERTHYLTRVLRLRTGTHIECFDGTGRAWSATLTEATARAATLAVGEMLAEQPPPAPTLHLVQGLLKGAAMDLVVQKATELGATDLWPVLAARSNVPRDAGRLQRKHEHWQRVMHSAAEQCGALYVPTLHEVCDTQAFFSEPPAAALMLLDPGAPPLPLSLPQRDTCLLIGPEGGWDEREREAALDAGAHRHGLGPRVLRGETAPLAVLAAVRHGWGWT